MSVQIMVLLYFRNNSQIRIPKLAVGTQQHLSNDTTCVIHKQYYFHFWHGHVKGCYRKLVWLFGTRFYTFFHEDATAAIGHGEPMTNSTKHFGTVKRQDIVLYWNLKIFWIASNAKRTEIECLSEGLYKGNDDNGWQLVVFFRSLFKPESLESQIENVPKGVKNHLSPYIPLKATAVYNLLYYYYNTPQ